MTTVIHVVVPCLGEAGPLEATLHSLAAQAADAVLRLHVQVAGEDAAAAEAAQRLGWWAEALPHLPRACRGMVFSHARAPAADLGAATIAGFAAAPPAPSAFAAVIEAGDLALPGFLAALARVAAQFPASGDPDLPEGAVPVDWVGLGLALVQRDGLPVALPDADIAADDIRAGRCDGVLAPLVPIAGMAFRGALWDAALPDVAADRPFDAALARAMAARADYVQLRRPLVGIQAAPPQTLRSAGAPPADPPGRAEPPAGAAAPAAERLELRLRAGEPTLDLVAVPRDGGAMRHCAAGAAVPAAPPPAVPGDGQALAAPDAGTGFVPRMLARVPAAGRLAPQDGLMILRACASALVTEPDAILPHLADGGTFAHALARARAALPPDHPTAVWFDDMLKTERAA